MDKNKILVFSILLVLLGSFALAQPNGSNDGVVVKGAEKIWDNINPDRLPSEVYEEAVTRMNESRNRVQIRSEVRGLERAFINVDNEFAVRALEMAMERFQEREMYKYDSYEIVEVDGKIIAEGKRQKSILGLFVLKFSDVYELDAEGEVLREKRSLASRLFPRDKIEGDS